MSTMERTIFSGMSVYLERKWSTNRAVVVENGHFAALISADMAKHHLPAKHIECSKEHRMLPGLIDLHVHGADNADVMDGSVEAMQILSAALARDGITGFLATTMTAKTKVIERVLSMIAKAADHLKGAALLGVHLEGPFIAKKKAGAQHGKYASLPDEALFTNWQNLSGNRIRIVTLAPELEGALNFIKMLRKNNVIASIGHTFASYHEVMAAIEAGATGATHLFNAMRGIHQREPGGALALLLSDNVIAELIADSLHLDPAMLELAYRVKSAERLVLISDAMRAKGMQDGEYDLGGQMVTVESGCARLADGTLAGSTLSLTQAIKYMADSTRASLEEAVHMATYVPARILGIETRKGSIEVGKDADLTILNSNFECLYTMREGKACFNALSS